ncbi:MAG: hypothetical protein HRU17_17985 [Polyangiaceae bacterium]|nr:hypothetical protein [Polyangiaceae bacterium]
MSKPFMTSRGIFAHDILARPAGLILSGLVLALVLTGCAGSITEPEVASGSGAVEGAEQPSEGTGDSESVAAVHREETAAAGTSESDQARNDSDNSDSKSEPAAADSSAKTEESPRSAAKKKQDRANETMKTLRGGFRKCFMEALDADPQLSGKLTVNPVKGGKLEVEVEGGLPDSMVKCVKSRISSYEKELGNDFVLITKPIVLKAGG